MKLLGFFSGAVGYVEKGWGRLEMGMGIGDIVLVLVLISFEQL